jgi:hypothetical protein
MNRLSWISSAWGVRVLIIAVLLLGAASYLPALAVIRDLEARLTSSREMLARLNSEIAVGRSGISESDHSVSPFAADFLPGGNESLVVANLQSRLRDLAIQNNVDLNSANNLPSRTEGSVNYLGLHIVVRGEIKDIQRVLHVIETGRPLLFVSRAAMRMDSWPITSNDPERNGRPALVAEMDVFAAMLPESFTAAGPEMQNDAAAGRPVNASGPSTLRGRR